MSGTWHRAGVTDAHRKGRFRLARACALTLLLVVSLASGAPRGSAPPAGAAPATGTIIGPGYYPRLVRLAHAGAADGTILATFQLGQEGQIYRSTDDGVTFTKISSVPAGVDTSLPAPGGVCCVELFEFPRPLGAFPAGTLLWAGSITVSTDPPPRRNRLAIWRSEDHGLTWVPHGACAEGPGGLWEPEFLVANDGSLACQYSDEDDETVGGPPVGQVLRYVVSDDGGVTWAPPVVLADGPFRPMRPGMATTAQLPDGSWAMTYELCGWLPPCQVRIKFSPDGLDWGTTDVLDDPVVETVDGGTFWHTPVLSWSPFGGSMGTLLLTGQLFMDADGNAEAASGATILANDRGGQGPWRAIAAPVSIPEPFDHYCPNYSSPVLALDGDGIVEFATEWTGVECHVRYATGTIPQAPAAPLVTSTVPSVTPVTARPTFAG